ncbi:MAG: DUF721 domain-containing protein [Gemmatimonadaceae bacterium]
MPNGKGGDDTPEPIADLLARFLRASGIAGRIEQSRVLDQWPALVGAEIAAVTRPLSVSEDGTMFVAVRSHAWMSELTMMERELLESVNREAGRRPIQRLRWSLMR